MRRPRPGRLCVPCGAPSLRAEDTQAQHGASRGQHGHPPRMPLAALVGPRDGDARGRVRHGGEGG